MQSSPNRVQFSIAWLFSITSGIAIAMGAYYWSRRGVDVRFYLYWLVGWIFSLGTSFFLFASLWRIAKIAIARLIRGKFKNSQERENMERAILGIVYAGLISVGLGILAYYFIDKNPTLTWIGFGCAAVGALLSPIVFAIPTDTPNSGEIDMHQP